MSVKGQKRPFSDVRASSAYPSISDMTSRCRARRDAPMSRHRWGRAADLTIGEKTRKPQSALAMGRKEVKIPRKVVKGGSHLCANGGKVVST